jgi:hypothetical protein
MKTVILKHRVADYTRWKPIYDADAPRRINAGLREIKVGQKEGDDNLVYMIWETLDATRLRKMIEDPELLEMMKKAGVIGEPEVVIIS